MRSTAKNARSRKGKTTAQTPAMHLNGAATDSFYRLVASCQNGWSLPQAFHNDETIYRRDVEQIWRAGWLFAGHTCEIPKAGDYFTVPVDTDSIIVIRAEDGSIHALHNVCRHRGSMICHDRC